MENVNAVFETEINPTYYTRTDSRFQFYYPTKTKLSKDYAEKQLCREFIDGPLHDENSTLNKQESQDMANDLSNSNKFDESWPSTIDSFSESPVKINPPKESKEHSVEEYIEKNGTLSSFVQRFRQQPPLPRRARENEKIPNFWWLESTKNDGKYSDPKQNQESFVSNPSVQTPKQAKEQHPSEYEDETTTLDVQSNAQRLLELSESTLSSDNTVLPSEQQKQIHQEKMKSTYNSVRMFNPWKEKDKQSEVCNVNKGYTKTSASKTLLRPEDDILYQWRLARKMEVAALQVGENSPSKNLFLTSSQIYNHSKYKQPRKKEVETVEKTDVTIPQYNNQICDSVTNTFKLTEDENLKNKSCNRHCSCYSAMATEYTCHHTNCKKCHLCHCLVPPHVHSYCNCKDIHQEKNIPKKSIQDSRESRGKENTSGFMELSTCQHLKPKPNKEFSDVDDEHRNSDKNFQEIPQIHLELKNRTRNKNDDDENVATTNTSKNYKNKGNYCNNNCSHSNTNNNNINQNKITHPNVNNNNGNDRNVSDVNYPNANFEQNDSGDKSGNSRTTNIVNQVISEHLFNSSSECGLDVTNDKDSCLNEETDSLTSDEEEFSSNEILCELRQRRGAIKEELRVICQMLEAHGR